ncbi:interferon regulatory factor 3-like [Pseudophryne corroboree]|uniref:interferon regulatory factor 3-like n=1 Tax=Pseudophryne corroboree TaxID=495146 RepID=UPI003081B483
MTSQKPRILTWLASQVGRKEYPGLKWVNSERTQLQVPWKHGSRQDRSEEEINIFKEWAIASRRYDPLKDKPDPVRWKRNFRSALSRKDGVCMIQCNSSDTDNPHKVYQITNECPTAPVERYASKGVTPTFQQTDCYSQQVAGTMYPQAAFSEDLDLVALCLDENDLYRSPGDLYATIDDLNKMTFSEQICNTAISPAQVNVYGIAAAPTSTCYDNNYPVHSDVPHPAEQVGEHVQPQPAQEPGNLKEIIRKHFTENKFETDFEVNIFYRGTLVESTLVKNPRGFYITSGKQPISGTYLGQVALPPPGTLVTNQPLVKAVDNLLTHLEQGTLVEVRGGSICANRSGKCHSYWSMTNTPTTISPNEIDKASYSVLYSVQQFVTELIAFIERRSNESPQYKIWICIGEKWPDIIPWDKKCIMVQITPVVMRLLHEMSYSTGASSLTNSDLNLEISDSLSSTNDVLSLLKEIDMMDWT